MAQSGLKLRILPSEFSQDWDFHVLPYLVSDHFLVADMDQDIAWLIL